MVSMADSAHSTQPKYDAFLSSGFSEFADTRRFGGDDLSQLVDLKPLREEVRRLLETQGLSVWTWEHWSVGAEGQRRLGRAGANPVPIFTQIAIFRRALIASKVVILFVANRRGSQIEPWDDGLRTYGTFLELEVYFAIALRKPIILLRERGGRLEAPLEELLKIARKAGVIRAETWIDRSELPQRSLDAYRGFEPRGGNSPGLFTSILARRRDPKLDFRSAMPFLFGLSLPPIGDTQLHPNLDVIDRLLTEERTENLLTSERLSRVWLALQEMLPARRRISSDKDLTERWLAALGRWSSAASWFGLHAHLGVSPFIAHAERARIIEGASGTNELLPYGPMASARYSIARREAFGLRRYREFNRVVTDSKRALETGKGDRAGYLSIMGHAFIQNARLLSAIEVFEQSLRLREAEGAAARIGEGKCDLGFALFLTLRYERGISMMEKGIALLENSKDPGFLFKSMRKLEIAYRLSGRGEEARQLKVRRANEAGDAEMFDQS
jgi:hypothetical protein